MLIMLIYVNEIGGVIFYIYFCINQFTQVRVARIISWKRVLHVIYHKL